MLIMWCCAEIEYVHGETVQCRIGFRVYNLTRLHDRCVLSIAILEKLYGWLFQLFDLTWCSSESFL